MMTEITDGGSYWAGWAVVRPLFCHYVRNKCRARQFLSSFGPSKTIRYGPPTFPMFCAYDGGNDVVDRMMMMVVVVVVVAVCRHLLQSLILSSSSVDADSHCCH